MENSRGIESKQGLDLLHDIKAG